MEIRRGEFITHALRGIETGATMDGDVVVTMIYGDAKAPGRMTFQMSIERAGNLAKGLVLAMKGAQKFRNPGTKQ